jgi:phosphonatase-like hydrolase
VYREGEVHAIAGSEATFRWCREQGIQVALTTGFDRAIVQLIMEKLGWVEAVDAVVCNDDVAHGRPAPDLILTAMRRLGHSDVSRVASVGDTISDLEAGANAGTGLNIGVLSGAHSREQLLAAPHSSLIDSVADLPAVLA